MRTRNKKTKEKKPYKIPTITQAQRRKRQLKELLYIFVPLIVLFFIIRVVFLIGVIPSPSMVPLMNTDSGIIANRIAYVFGEPQRGDVIVFKKGDSFMTKRIIGIPEDEVSVQNGMVYINGQPIVEDYVQEGIETKPANDINCWQVPAGAYFVLGDNRPNSNDSRKWEKPFVPMEDIVAKVICVFSINPFSHGLYCRGVESINIEETYAGVPSYDPSANVTETTAVTDASHSESTAAGSNDDNQGGTSPTLPVSTIAPESISETESTEATEETTEGMEGGENPQENSTESLGDMPDPANGIESGAGASAPPIDAGDPAAEPTTESNEE